MRRPLPVVTVDQLASLEPAHAYSLQIIEVPYFSSPFVVAVCLGEHDKQELIGVLVDEQQIVGAASLDETIRVIRNLPLGYFRVRPTQVSASELICLAEQIHGLILH